MRGKYAVIDLGSNTFHILVASYSNGEIQHIERSRSLVSLCELGGTSIGEEAYIRGIEACKQFKTLIDLYKPDGVRCVGTSALRTSINKVPFIRDVENVLNTKVEVIDGITEARLIYKGMMSYRNLENDSHIGIDIGGGSTEFIYKKNPETQEIYKSYEIGIGSLFQQFHKTDPISNKDLLALKSYINQSIYDLREESDSEVKYLMGAAGSFEILEAVYALDTATDTGTDIPANYISALCDKIISLNKEERSKIPGIPPERNKYIVVACAIILEAINIWKPKYVIASPYGLKEGILREMVAGE
jgi:exopolyphosphatase / guanosine-5'-triphosphate,3'-diphosphate pyrophosphatase